MIVFWLVVALVTWPLVALAIGVLLGRGIAVGDSRLPRRVATPWLRRELPRDMVAPLPSDREATRI